MKNNPPLLTVYGREHCHLCHDMIAALEPLQASMGFRLETVDVDDDPLLVRQYNELVPVLTGNGREICHYHLDLAALAAYLNAANP